MASSTAKTKTPDQKTKFGIILPEEHFWKCYSPNGELPLSSVVSVTGHALLFGLLVFGAIFASLIVQEEAFRPPRMDVVEITGGGGVGGMGGPGLGGVPSNGNGGKTEVAQADPSSYKPDPKTQDPELKQNIETKKLEIPDEKDPTPITNDANALFAELKKEATRLDKAREELAKALKIPKSSLNSAGKTGGVRNSGGGSPGTGGGRGGGQGTGFGTGVGPGGGTDPNGKLLTKTQRREMRWEVDFSGSGLEHLKKLKALKIMLAVPTPQQGYFRVFDFSGSGPRIRLDDLSGYKNKVKWFNVHAPSLTQLSKVIQLHYVPKYVIVFLPPEVEEEMARLEVAYQGKPENLIRFTRFEIRLRNDGTYGPVVVAQE